MLPSRRLVRPAADDDFVICQKQHLEPVKFFFAEDSVKIKPGTSYQVTCFTVFIHFETFLLFQA